jgi:hypothetical protein
MLAAASLVKPKQTVFILSITAVNEHCSHGVKLCNVVSPYSVGARFGWRFT